MSRQRDRVKMIHRIRRQRIRALGGCLVGGVAVTASGLLAGCGNITAGGATGTATVTVASDAIDTQGAALTGAARFSSLAAPGLSAGEVEGQVEADFYLFLETAAGTAVPLSQDEIQVRLDIKGRQEIDAVDRLPVLATQYSRLRIVFSDIRVEVSAGLIINGVPVLGEVRVELDDTTLTVVRPLSLDVADGQDVFLLLDLNVNTWLQAVDPVLKVINEAAFADVISVAVQ